MVVGGLAVILHGFVRATGDLDLIVSLDKENLKAFLSLVKKRGYKPKAPVKLEDFAETEKRLSWFNDKGMLVFSLYHPKFPQELVDIFVNEPIPFDKAYRRRKIKKMGPIPISVIGLKDLIFLKKKANRPQDKEDIKALKRIGKKIK